MAERQYSSEQHIIFLIFFTVYLSAAVYIKIHLGYLPEELLIRTQQFIDILSGSQNIKQSIIGSILLPPLPFIMRVPFAFLPLKINVLFMGNVISALFGAGSVLFLNTLMKNYNWNRLPRVLLLSLFGLYPLLVFTSASGSDTALFIFFFTSSLVYLLLWLKKEKIQHILFITLHPPLLYVKDPARSRMLRTINRFPSGMNRYFIDPLLQDCRLLRGNTAAVGFTGIQHHEIA